MAEPYVYPPVESHPQTPEEALEIMMRTARAQGILSPEQPQQSPTERFQTLVEIRKERIQAGEQVGDIDEQIMQVLSEMATRASPSQPQAPEPILPVPPPSPPPRPQQLQLGAHTTGGPTFEELIGHSEQISRFRGQQYEAEQAARAFERERRALEARQVEAQDIRTHGEDVQAIEQAFGPGGAPAPPMGRQQLGIYGNGQEARYRRERQKRALEQAIAEDKRRFEQRRTAERTLQRF